MTTTFPSETDPDGDIPGAYSEATQELNIKEREVCCPVCHYCIVTNLAGPRCKQCHSYLIVPLKRKTLDELVR